MTLIPVGTDWINTDHISSISPDPLPFPIKDCAPGFLIWMVNGTKVRCTLREIGDIPLKDWVASLNGGITGADLAAPIAIAAARDLAFRYGGIDGAHHKQWVIDQTLQILLGKPGYQEFLEEYNTHPNGNMWERGVAP